MKRFILFFTFLLFLLSGCAVKDNNSQQKVSYNYPPPVDGLSWGMSEKEVLNSLDLEDSDVKWQEYEGINLFGAEEQGKYRFFVLDDSLDFLGEKVTATFLFYNEIGLEEIALSLNNRSEQNVEVTVQLKLQENYESSWGTDVLQLEDEQKEKLKEYLLANGMPQEAVDWVFEEKDQPRHPLASYELDTNPNSPAYGTVVFHGYLAAMLEHALETN